MDMKYLEAIYSLSSEIKSLLSQFPEDLQPLVREIGMRTQKPISVSTMSGVYFPKRSGGFVKGLPYTPYIATKEDIFECMQALTQYSLHSCKNEIKSGFLTVKGGHRAGISGSCVYENGKVLSVNEISSINLRVARQINGVAEGLTRELFKDGLKSVLIVGAPASGKTTILKDIARCLGNGMLGFTAKLSIIDERGEIAAVHRGIPQNDIGVMSDVFDGYKKGDGMLFAIRSMSPQVLMLDEISGNDDIEGIRQGLNAGVNIIATVHAGSLDELYRKQSIQDLLIEGGFERIVMLCDKDTPGKVKEILTPKEMATC